MRITGGRHRSRRLIVPTGGKTRPSMDKVRQAVFSILQDVRGTTVLDLFAGSGAYGLEALSRGAKSVTFIDHDLSAIRAIRENARLLQETALGIRRADWRDALRDLHDEGESFDLVFIDPPYAFGDLQELCDRFFEDHLLSKNATMIIETHAPLDLLLPEGFSKKEHVYGYARLCLIKKE